MSRDLWIQRWATSALVVVALLVGGCGSGAVDGPDEEDDAATDESGDAGGSGGDDRDDGGGGDGGGGGDRYSWNLPVGDITPDDSYILYSALRGGCDAGAAEVGSDQYRNLTDEQRRLYDAAIAVCRGDVESGRTLFAGAGHGGSRSMCFIHAAVVSVLEQRPPDTSGCPPNPGEGTTATTDPGESGTSTESTPSTEGEGETTGSTGEGETTTTEAAGVGDGGG
jgi:hypothetical protein